MTEIDDGIPAREPHPDSESKQDVRAAASPIPKLRILTTTSFTACSDDDFPAPKARAWLEKTLYEIGSKIYQPTLWVQEISPGEIETRGIRVKSAWAGRVYLTLQDAAHSKCVAAYIGVDGSCSWLKRELKERLPPEWREDQD